MVRTCRAGCGDVLDHANTQEAVMAVIHRSIDLQHRRTRHRGRAAPAGAGSCLSWIRQTGVVMVGLLTGLVLIPVEPATAKSNVTEQIRCLALTIYFEARGEPDEGKLAVAHVVMNRASHPLFPRDVCQVVRQGGEKLRYRCQFTWWCDGRSDRPRDSRAWRHSLALARRVFWDASEDPTGGALWYHAASVRPAWRTALQQGPTIGRHVFYRALTRIAEKSPPRTAPSAPLEPSATPPEPAPHEGADADAPWNSAPMLIPAAYTPPSSAASHALYGEPDSAAPGVAPPGR
ncbi:MAG: cell wall hydrolase [Alphaproteobacteria bacterium]|nr:MAG: cell wall hydrolase [Alphaproteobacteria bacterium]